MTAMPRHRRQAILREATGYIELGELLVQQDTPVPPSGQRLLHRALDLLALLPEPTRSTANAASAGVPGRSISTCCSTMIWFSTLHR